MRPELFGSTPPPLDDLFLVKRAAPVLLLAFFWCWETWRPFFGQSEGRWRHAAHNLAIALFNTVVLGLVFASFTLTVVAWTEENQFGLLNVLGISGPLRFLLALVLLDGWMYVWHRANHVIPFLWRFHRMHHSDTHMDVTTATRFHLGEHIGASVLRLGLIPLVGFEVWNLVVYDTLVIAVTQFHHADITLGRWDGWLRLFIVTPDMHKVHHSDWRPETDSNYSTVLSVWDRLARSFRLRPDPKTLVFGLGDFTEASWQTWWGMLRTPFVNPPVHLAEAPSQDPASSGPFVTGTGMAKGATAMPDAERPKRLLFICNENCNRSQMAEAFARIFGGTHIEAYSAGCHPAVTVHPKAVVAMRELGYDMAQHHPKGLSSIPAVEFDAVVTMGCDDNCTTPAAKHREDWNIPVPKWLPPDQFRAVRDQIGEKVKALLASL